MPRIKKVLAFPRAVTTNDKVNITSLILAIGEVSKDPVFRDLGLKMTNSLYSKTQERALRRATALLAVLRSHA
jgi:hypothetical protein